MSLQGLVDATAEALGGARDLWGSAAQAAGLPSTSEVAELEDRFEGVGGYGAGDLAGQWGRGLQAGR